MLIYISNTKKTWKRQRKAKQREYERAQEIESRKLIKDVTCLGDKRRCVSGLKNNNKPIGHAKLP